MTRLSRCKKKYCDIMNRIFVVKVFIARLVHRHLLFALADTLFTVDQSEQEWHVSSSLYKHIKSLYSHSNLHIHPAQSP